MLKERTRLVKLTRHATNIARSLTTQRFCACLVFLSWVVQPSFSRQKLDQVLVYGDNFMFGVQEPAGWTGDTSNAASFEASMVLHESGQPSDSWFGLIRIRVSSKVDENTSADLAEDIRSYQAQFPDVQFKDLSVANPRYVCLAKLFYIPGKSYEYVAYVNPGPKKPFLFSVSMNTPKSEASAKELEAYKLAIQSLTLLKP
jgi:hypothetical protein